MRRLLAGLLLLAGAAVGCGPATVRPVSFPDSDVGCPGGRVAWTLQIEDQRLKRDAQERMTAAVRDAVQRSFPTCRWGTTDADEGTIAIEVHRFASHLDAGFWEAAVEWTVTARNAGGHTVTQFEVNEEVTRPNYQGSDNEKESLSEAFGKAIERTSKGLGVMSVSEIFRHPAGTVAATALTAARGGLARPNPSLQTVSAASAPAGRVGAPVEWISQLRTSEGL